MRTIALVALFIGLSASALAGPIDDQFAAGVGGIPWGTKLHDLVAIRPGGDHDFSTAPGDRSYALLDDEPLFGIPRAGTRIQYHFGKHDEVESVSIGVPYERREQLLGQLLASFGQYRTPVTRGTAISYYWPADRRCSISVRASREPRNGILEFWVHVIEERADRASR
jgi:hypothetical protein